VPYLSALEVCSRRGVIQSHVYLYLYLTAWQVMVAEALDIERETYLAFLMDRTCSGPVVVGSPMGGMDIEEVAKTHPDAIHKVCQQ